MLEERGKIPVRMFSIYFLANYFEGSKPQHSVAFQECRSQGGIFIQPALNIYRPGLKQSDACSRAYVGQYASSSSSLR